MPWIMRPKPYRRDGCPVTSYDMAQTMTTRFEQLCGVSVPTTAGRGFLSKYSNIKSSGGFPRYICTRLKVGCAAFLRICRRLAVAW